MKRIQFVQIHLSEHYGSNYLIENGNTRFFKFGKCLGPRCKIKCRDNNLVLPLNNFRSNFNCRSYGILTGADLDCRSENVVYLVTCNVCRLQYVGETSRGFSIRMREHLDKIRKGDKSQHLYRHFNSDDQHKN